MTDWMDAPPLTGASIEETAEGFSNFRPGFGSYMKSMAAEGFWSTTTGQALAHLRVQANDPAGARRLPMDEWQSSPWFRSGLSWDEGMTAGRAQALADIYDENSFRRWIIDARRPGAAEQVAGFGAAMLGSIPAAENFIPVAGPAFRTAQALRLARAGVPVLEAATARMGQIGGRAVVFGADAAAGTAMSEPLVLSSREGFGDDVSHADILLDIALGAAAGSVLGAAAGVWSHARGAKNTEPLPDFKTQQGAMDIAAKAQIDIADGRPVNLAELPNARETLEGVASVTGRRMGDADKAPMRELQAAQPEQRGEALAEFYRMANSEQGVALQKQRLRLGEVSPAQAQRIKDEAGLDVTGYRRSVDVAEARHINRKHGPDAPASKNGGLPVTDADVARYFDVVEAPDAVYASTNARGLPVLIHEKQIGDWHYVAEEVRAGKKVLALETFYKERNRTEPKVGSGGRSGGADVEPGLARPKRTPAQPAEGKYRAGGAAPQELSPAWVEPDLAPAAELAAPAATPIPKNRAEEHGLDAATGDFHELADLKRMDAEGRLTDAERKALEAAEADLKKTDKAADAHAAAVHCALGG